MGLVYAAIATPLVLVDSHRTVAALVWPSCGIAVAWLWRAPRHEWPSAMVAIAVAMSVVGWMSPLPHGMAVAIALVDALSVGGALELGRRFVSHDGEIDTTRRLTRFLLLIPGLSACLSACAIGGLSVVANPSSFWSEWQRVMCSNGLPLLVLVPGYLAWSKPVEPAQPAVSWWMIALPSALAAGLLTGVSGLRMPAQSAHGILALLLIWAAIRGSMRGATLGAFVLVWSCIALTASDYGSYHGQGWDGVGKLQLDLAMLSALVFYVAVALDERRRYANRLALARRLESIGMLASGIVHDFNNVLAVIRGYAELAEELMPPHAESKPPMREVLDAVGRGQHMTQRLLTAVGQREPMRAERVPMRIVMEKTVSAFAVSPDSRIALEYEIDTSLAHAQQAADVIGEQAQLVRMLVNLTRNAMLAARSRVVLRLGAATGDARLALNVGRAPQGRLVWVDIADDGPGIADALVERVFEPFYSTRIGRGGHGLGLSIASTIATDHRGGIAYRRDERLGGARFRVVLPAAPAAESDAGTVAPSRAPAAATHAPPHDAPDASADALLADGETAIVVDGDPQRLTLCEEWVAQLGFAPVAFTELLPALDALRDASQPPALLICVSGSPHFDGEPLARIARALLVQLPIVFIGEAAQARDVLAEAGIALLAGPFDRAALAATIIAARTAAAHRAGNG